MKLLYTPRSPYARKVRVVAIEKGINFRMPRLWAAADYPKLARWYEEFLKRPSMKETMLKEK